ncbi:hypothetical protein DL96DRAFT_344180 [Flagelloscypha sp. PMI_526]|nr:hypothetical protein DL96DRAFT_344180 [Flagelloscypha sp. PMI_526]
MSEDFPAFLIRFQYHRQVTNYLQYASITLLAWDFLTMLSTEIKYIWSKRVGWGTLLYAANRFAIAVSLTISILAYSSPFVNDTVCRVWVTHLSNLLPMFQSFASEAAFANRVLVIVAWRPIYVYTIIPFLVVSHIISMILSQLSLRGIGSSSTGLLGGKGLHLCFIFPSMMPCTRITSSNTSLSLPIIPSWSLLPHT